MKQQLSPPLDRLPRRHYWSYAYALAGAFGTPMARKCALYRLPIVAVYYISLFFIGSTLFTYAEGRRRGMVVRIIETKELQKRPSRSKPCWVAAAAFGELLIFMALTCWALPGCRWLYLIIFVSGIYLVCEALPSTLRRARHGDGTSCARWAATQQGRRTPYIRVSGLIGVRGTNEGVVLTRRLMRWITSQSLCIVTEALNKERLENYVKLGLSRADGSTFGVYGP